MATLRLTSKGQVTLRKEFLQHLGINPGDVLEVTKLPSGVLNIRAKRSDNKSFSDFAGILHDKTAIQLSDEELEQAIAQSAVAFAQRGLGDE